VDAAKAALRGTAPAFVPIAPCRGGKMKAGAYDIRGKTMCGRGARGCAPRPQVVVGVAAVRVFFVRSFEF
jgi:hypothetical protein